jgi:hypothetical protein
MCEMCGSESSKSHAQGAIGDVAYPVERMELDISGPPSVTDRNNRFILVVDDCFTKWVELFEIPNHKAETAANCF